MDAWGLVLLTTLLVYLVLMQFSLSNLSRQQKQQAERFGRLTSGFGWSWTISA